MAELDRVRVDVWLWAVRAFRTRSAANEACRSGKVRVAGSPAKPATKVGAGDDVSVKMRDRRLEYRVEKIISKRLGAELAKNCYVDNSPEPEVDLFAQAGFTDRSSGKRDAGTGRPTKRDRRKLDRLRGDG